MQDLLFDYLCHPSKESYMRTRAALFAEPDYNPYNQELTSLKTLIAQEEYATATQQIERILYPDYMLSPRAHLTLGVLYHKLGQPSQSNVHYTIGAHCIQGIQWTGNGTKDQPYLITRVSDALDIFSAANLPLAHHRLEQQGQRQFEVLTSTNKQEMWFDCTDVANVLRNLIAQLERSP